MDGKPSIKPSVYKTGTGFQILPLISQYVEIKPKCDVHQYKDIVEEFFKLFGVEYDEKGDNDNSIYWAKTKGSGTKDEWSHVKFLVDLADESITISTRVDDSKDYSDRKKLLELTGSRNKMLSLFVKYLYDGKMLV